jgi:hypothetical protein
VKGSVLESRLAYVRDARGEAAVQRVLARLPEDDQLILGGMVLPFVWYPFATNQRLDRAIAEEFAMGDRIFLLLGEASARHNLQSQSQKSYIREKNPHALLKQTSAIYEVYYDSGYRTYERVSDGRAVLRTIDSESFSIEDCLTVVGWHQTAIALCGGRNASVIQTQCRARGATVCEYVCEWE